MKAERDMAAPTLISTVTPVYRGAAHLPQLVAELRALREKLQSSAIPIELTEAIFVDDSSQDDSGKMLAQLESEHEWVRVITLSRNYGQHPATVAGILHASGDWIATLDEDLQHHPADILALLEAAVVNSDDLVYAQPDGVVHRNWYRDYASRWFKTIASRLTARPEVRQFNSFRIIRGQVARAAAAVSRHETYLDVALCWFTDRIGSHVLTLVDRRHGTGRSSAYSLGALADHARRLLVSSEVRVLKLGSAVGLLALVMGLASALAIIFQKLLWPATISVRGWASLMVAIVFFGGLIAFLVSLALEYLSHIYLHILGRPTFFVVDRGKDHELADALQTWARNGSRDW